MLVPLIIFLLSSTWFEYKFLCSGIVFLIASYTDFLDGNLARKNNIITNFGQIMDPMADKILVSAILIFFVGLGFVPALAAAVIILREFVITSVRFLVFQTSRRVVSANILGKLKTVSQMAAIITIFSVQSCLEISKISCNFIMQNLMFFEVLQSVLIWIAALLSLISGLVYIYLNRKSIISSF